MSYQLVCSYNSPNHYITEINKNTNKNVNLLRIDLLNKTKKKKQTPNKPWTVTNGSTASKTHKTLYDIAVIKSEEPKHVFF